MYRLYEKIMNLKKINICFYKFPCLKKILWWVEKFVNYLQVFSSFFHILFSFSFSFFFYTQYTFSYVATHVTSASLLETHVANNPVHTCYFFSILLTKILGRYKLNERGLKFNIIFFFSILFITFLLLTRINMFYFSFIFWRFAEKKHLEK